MKKVIIFLSMFLVGLFPIFSQADSDVSYQPRFGNLACFENYDKFANVFKNIKIVMAGSFTMAGKKNEGAAFIGVDPKENSMMIFYHYSNTDEICIENITDNVMTSNKKVLDSLHNIDFKH